MGAGEAIARVLDYPGAADLLARLGGEAVVAERITTLRTQGSERFVYRVGLADGRTVKLRRPHDPARAARAWHVLDRLRDPRFAVVILREGDLVVEEWVEGTVLVQASPAPEQLDCAAALLASLHRARVPGLETGGAVPAASLRDATCSRIDGLRQYAFLSAAEVGSLCRTVRRLAPEQTASGIAHNDFCGENLVLDPAGAVRVIDNEDVAPGFVGLDLARTWYRWGLDPGSWRRFVDGYVAAGGERPDPGAFEFWKIAAVAKSAVVLLAADQEPRERALARLRALAA